MLFALVPLKCGPSASSAGLPGKFGVNDSV